MDAPTPTFDFNLENVSGKPFRNRKYPQYEYLTKLLFAMIEGEEHVPHAFCQAVSEYNECLGYRNHALVLWLAGIIKAYDPRETIWEDVLMMHQKMLESGKYTQEEIDKVNDYADRIFKSDTYGKVLPDIDTLELVLEFYLKKYEII